jgi:tetratricopeptide (TPR) repeat protein
MMCALFCAWMALSGPGVAEAAVPGDESFLRINYPEAVSRYESALGEHPGEPAFLWRLARVYVCMGEVAEGEERVHLLAMAEQCARACIAADSTVVEGHTWLAGVLGYRALEEGASEQIRLSQELVREANQAIRLNANEDAAYSILGSFYRALGGVGWLKRSVASLFLGSIPEGGYAEAEAALRRAVAIAPGIMRHQYELGILYIDMGREEEARQALEAAGRLPVKTAIDRPRLEKIHELLSRLTSPQ